MSGPLYGRGRRRSNQGKRPNSTPLLREWDACEVCGKRTWHNKKAAKAAIRQLPGERLDVYPACNGYGHHVGHVSPRITSGELSRDQWRKLKGVS